MGKMNPWIKLLQNWNYFHIHNGWSATKDSTAKVLMSAWTVTSVEQLLNLYNEDLHNQVSNVASQRKLIL